MMKAMQAHALLENAEAVRVGNSQNSKTEQQIQESAAPNKHAQVGYKSSALLETLLAKA